MVAYYVDMATQTSQPHKTTQLEHGVTNVVNKVLQETTVGIEDARNHFPGKPGYYAVLRWATHGYKGILLESAPVGRRRYTSVEAIARFLNALAAADSAIRSGSAPVVNIEQAQLEAEFAV